MPQKKLSLVLASIVVVSALCYANWPDASNKEAIKADKIIVHKSAHRMDLLSKGGVVKSYPVSFGSSPLGQKFKEGDGKTPEGVYTIDSKNPNSRFHLALHISYPSPDQLAQAKAQNTDAGGMIMVHGIMNGLGWMGRFQRLINWTTGCIALTNPEIEQVYNAVPVGTPIEILP